MGGSEQVLTDAAALASRTQATVTYQIATVYGVKLDFVSERTIKDHHQQQRPVETKACISWRSQQMVVVEAFRDMWCSHRLWLPLAADARLVHQDSAASG